MPKESQFRRVVGSGVEYSIRAISGNRDANNLVQVAHTNSVEHAVVSFAYYRRWMIKGNSPPSAMGCLRSALTATLMHGCGKPYQVQMDDPPWKTPLAGSWDFVSVTYKRLVPPGYCPRSIQTILRIIGGVLFLAIAILWFASLVLRAVIWCA
jgi:hypothetical protein